MSKLKL